MNKKEANRKLEKGVMRSDAFLVAGAFSEGASIGYKFGTFFGTACRLGNLEIVEMFVLDHTFVRKANYYQKEYINPKFHEGLTYAIANGRLEVVQFLNESPIYQKLKKLDEFIVNGLETAVIYKYFHVVEYILRNSSVLGSEEYKNNKFSNYVKDFIESIVLSIKLDIATKITCVETTKSEKIKIKI